jgi:hypothetical protein
VFPAILADGHRRPEIRREKRAEGPEGQDHGFASIHVKKAP